MKNGIEYGININSPIAVYVQIKNIVQFAVASGKLTAGTALPSVRVLSQDLDINPNTVTKAFRDLELMGMVTTRRGVGVTITENAADICRDSIRHQVKSHLIDAVAECAASGISAKDIRQVVSATIDNKNRPYEQNE